MRFNDLMQTVLAAQGSGSGAVTLWRQCVDLLAQNDRPGKTPLHPRDRAALLDRMERLRGEVTETQRIATVVELGGRLASPTLVRFFAGDRPAICAAAMARARLPDTLWPSLLSDLGPTARGVLRGRRDLGPETVRALHSFGSTDFVLGSDVAEPEIMLLTPEMTASLVAEPVPVVSDPEVAPAPTETENQIRRLVDRIERYTSSHRVPAQTSASAPTKTDPRDFTFETDAQGVVIWVDGGLRAALIGLSIAAPALPGGSGPDAHVSGAYVRRSGFQNGRFAIAGGMMAGEWRLSAVPFFDPLTGRFQGYRGHARRPYLHEAPVPAREDALPLGGLSGDSVRQLVHELRTPLNAILGFAEIIEQQLFGPADDKYCEMASAIIGDARLLLTAFEDLDLAARVSHGDDVASPTSIDTALLVAGVATRFNGDAGVAPVDISVNADLPHVRIDPVQGERMVQHLLRTLVSVTPTAEAVTGSCWYQPGADGGRVVLAMDRPSTLKGMEETQLLDPGYSPDGDWPDAPLLGLGFSLRLIRSLAAGSGGSLDIDADRFMLLMPVAYAEDGAERGAS